MIKFQELPYGFDALEPYYNEQTLKIHFQLYKKYFENLIKVNDKLEITRNTGYYENIKCLEKELSFQGSGYILHKLFFENMTPIKNTHISNELNNRINNDFGSFSKFKNQFIEAARNVEASGWCLLCWIDELEKLEILQCEKHQNLTLWGNKPILVLDMWEHSYFLQYFSDRSKYIDEFWKIVNWNTLNERYKKIKNITIY